MQTRLNRVICRIDKLNREDPNDTPVSGTPMPGEFAYAQRLTAWVKRLDPQASELLLIAARGQHVRRWVIPRSDYPEGRAGYLKWREDLKTMHAQVVSGIMADEGYSPEECRKVEAIIRKRDLKDSDTQTIEDALCLMFLQYQIDDLLQKTDPQKMPAILQKTWRKMSERGHRAAAGLNYSDPARVLLEASLEIQLPKSGVSNGDAH